MSYEYLDILKRALDDQQKKVCCRTDNTVVAAGAGSGKTQVLATRFAWLLMEDSSLKASSILTLTFTKKAAAEMYQRIYETLTVFAEDKTGTVDEKRKENAKRAIEDFASVHIQTMDSYCGGIVRQGANRYGIRPDFSSGSADADSNIKKLALPFVLLHRNRNGIQHFCEAGKLQNFAEEVIAKIIISYTSLATPAGYFMSCLDKQKKGIIAEWNNTVSSSSNLSLKDCVNKLADILCDVDTVKDLTASPVKIQPLIDKFKYDNIPEFNQINSLDQKKAVEDVYDWLTSISYNKRQFSKRNDVAESAKSVLGALSDIAVFVSSIMAWIQDYEYLVDLYGLLDEFLIKVNTNKRISGALTFKDVSEMALKILIEQQDIREQEKSSYKKIMIDEFQDNNGKNRDLLFLLSEKEGLYTLADTDDEDALHKALKQNIVKDKLFFVGDEKQSIYKFRGADVSVFNELKHDLEQINGPDSYMHMIYNYRSCAELLASFNIIFGSHSADGSGGYKTTNYESVFDNKKTLSFEASYTEDAIAQKVDSEHNLISPVVLTKDNVKTHASLFIYSDADLKTKVKQNLVLNKDESIAYYIASKIRQMYDNDTDAEKSWDKYAVLDRSRTNRHYLTQWLERFHIPYSLDQQSRLFNDAPVNDIYSFMRLCVYPSDINAFASFICSPFTGLTEGSLEKVLGQTVDITDENFVFEAFSDKDDIAVSDVLGADTCECERYFKAKEFYKANQQKVLAQNITDTLNLLWYERGYRYETLLNKNVNLFEEQYDLLFELARQSDEQGKGLGWFVDQLALQKNSEGSFGFDDAELDTKEVSYPVEKGSCVQIMTIHKSKGLQFDHVFLTGVSGAGKKEQSSNVFFNEKYGVSLKPANGSDNYFYLEQKKDSDLKALAEFRRLIYVGATRAVKDLYIVGQYSLNSKGEHTIGEMDVLDKLFIQYYEDLNTSDVKERYNPGAPFDLNLISEVPKSVLFTDSKNESIDELRHKKIIEMDTLISSGELKIIDTPVLKSCRVSASALESLADDNNVTAYTEPNNLDMVFKKIITVDQNFGFNDLGTIVHFYFEQHVKGVDNDLIFEMQSYVKKLSQVNIDVAKNLHKVCCTLLSDFDSTDKGSEIIDYAQRGGFIKTEYAFKTFIEGYIVSGIIDLCFEKEDGSLVIVDYKTDHAVKPELYYGQQTCYRSSLALLRNKKVEDIKCLLYYVRHKKFVDISDKANTVIDRQTLDCLSMVNQFSDYADE